MDPSPTPLPPHLERPHLRRVLPQPVNNEQGQQGLALRDPLMLCRQTIVIPVEMAQALQHFNGEWTQDNIATNLKAPAEAVSTLVAKLDELGLLWGPTSKDLEEAMLRSMHAEGMLPLRQSGMLGETPKACHDTLDTWLDATEDPELSFQPAGLFAPRIDYSGAVEVYAGLYHAIRDQDITRVLLLGNNQFGFGDGVIGTRLGFQSPMGQLECDTEFVDALVGHLGEGFTSDEIDHVASHCIEMQVPWIQQCIGRPKVVGVLLPNPLEPTIDDEPSVTTEAFIAAAREVIAASEGRTLVIGAGDLSHIGPQFGEPRAIDAQRQAEADHTDRELIATFSKGDPEAFLSAIKWNANANRWSGIGAMMALLGIVQPSTIEMIDYHQHPLDDQGHAMIASVGLALGT